MVSQHTYGDGFRLHFVVLTTYCDIWSYVTLYYEEPLKVLSTKEEVCPYLKTAILTFMGLHDIIVVVVQDGFALLFIIFIEPNVAE